MSDDEDLQRIFDNHERIEQRRRAPAIDREAWLMASRRMFDPGPRQDCWVCGKFKSIAQAHHIIPLTTQYDRGYKYPNQEHVWLCPNHHAMAHLFIQDDNRSMLQAALRARGRTMARVFPDLSEDEFEKMLELMRRAGRSPE
jgi:hypothetical protein